jgi:truncated hemoglobin YjbI
MTAEITLYDLLGGDRARLRMVTQAAYERILADDLLAPYFASVDIATQASMLAEFLAMAFGGPDAYRGRDLRTAHAHLDGLTDAHFDRVVDHLAAALRTCGVSEGDIATAAAVADTVRADVLSR